MKGSVQTTLRGRKSDVEALIRFLSLASLDDVMYGNMLSLIEFPVDYNSCSPVDLVEVTLDTKEDEICTLSWFRPRAYFNELARQQPDLELVGRIDDVSTNQALKYYSERGSSEVEIFEVQLIGESPFDLANLSTPVKQKISDEIEPLVIKFKK